MSLLDVDEVPSIFERSRLWSVGRFNLVSFYPEDYIGGGRDNIKSEVKKRIRAGTGRQFEGRVLLLTHTRYLGFCFNPVSFYFCFEGSMQQPRFILAEINNTPWNERHCYVLENGNGDASSMEFEFDKVFHVSPFMPMDLKYRWRFDLDPDGIGIEMALLKDDSVCFEASLDLQSQAFTAASMKWVPLKYPFMTAAVVLRIYWQALLLWLKRIPFYDHPKRSLKDVDYEHVN